MCMKKIIIMYISNFLLKASEEINNNKITNSIHIKYILNNNNNNKEQFKTPTILPVYLIITPNYHKKFNNYLLENNTN